MSQVHTADVERQEFEAWLRNPAESAQFSDPLHRRIVDVVTGLRKGGATGIELAVLLRQHAVRWSKHPSPDGVVVGPASGLSQAVHELVPNDAWAKAGLVVTPAGGECVQFAARRWTPSWIENPQGLAIDEASRAGTGAGWRQRSGLSPADPVFRASTGYETYKTPGQKAAVRTALEMARDGVCIANLPTGSGKTEVVLTLASELHKEHKSTVMVVPTVALAIDLERRMRAEWTRRGFDAAGIPFAFTGSTSETARDALKQRLQLGRQPIIVTSPESLTGALLEAVRSGCEGHRIGALVVDEAHLITSWGRSFRPEFRLLGELWGQMNEWSSSSVRAVLLSATLNAETVKDLVEEFPAANGPYVVAANALRSEPHFWVSPPATPAQRELRILESITRVPRPAVLYVTKPEDAKDWVRRLKEEGYQRVTMVTGDSNDSERQAALEGIRTGERPSEYDLVVATSAFGLGIDADEIRSVIHACLPESVDRWYQEVGRGGRDGYTSLALLMPAYDDKGDALSLGVTVLKPEIAEKRWKALWDNREELDGRAYVNLRHAPPPTQDGSYNRRWNSQVLEALTLLGVLKRWILTSDEIVQLGLQDQQRPGDRLRDAWQRIELQGSPPDANFFATQWVNWKAGADAASFTSVAEVERLAVTGDACHVVRMAYSASEWMVDEWGPLVAEAFATDVLCGRCQACSRASVDDRVAWAPDPELRWGGLLQPSALADLIEQYDTGRGVAVVEASQDRLEESARALVSMGAKLAVGASAEATADFPFVDGELNPASTVPVATVVHVPDSRRLQEVLRDLNNRVPTADGTKAPVVVWVNDLPHEWSHRIMPRNAIRGDSQ